MRFRRRRSFSRPSRRVFRGRRRFGGRRRGGGGRRRLIQRVGVRF